MTSNPTSPSSPASSPVVIHISSPILALGRNAYLPENEELVAVATSHAERDRPTSVLVKFSLREGTYCLIPVRPEILGGTVRLSSISRNGRFVCGDMETMESASSSGEGFIAPVNSLDARTFIGFLDATARTSLICDVSDSGIGVGYATCLLEQGSRSIRRAIAWSEVGGLRTLNTPSNRPSRANGLSVDGRIAVGELWPPDDRETACYWMNGAAHQLQSDRQGFFGRCSPDGNLFVGERQLEVLIRSMSRPYHLYGDPGQPLRGTADDATNSGFVVGHAILRINNNPSGFFNTERLAFIWHISWPSNRPPLTIRRYVLSRTGVDSGFDLTRAEGITEHDGMLYITGHTKEIRGVAVKVVARP